MFNETCGPGQVQDFDPATGQYLPGCVDDTVAYRAGDTPLGVVNVKPKAGDGWTTYLIYGGVALVLLAVLKR
jgi:hypothetical protein